MPLKKISDAAASARTSEPKPTSAEPLRIRLAGRGRMLVCQDADAATGDVGRASDDAAELGSFGGEIPFAAAPRTVEQDLPDIAAHAADATMALKKNSGGSASPNLSASGACLQQTRAMAKELAERGRAILKDGPARWDRLEKVKLANSRVHLTTRPN